MSKERKDSSLKIIFKLLIFFIFVSIIALIIWRLYGIGAFEQRKLYENFNKKQERSLHDMYYVKRERADKNIYYIRINDIFTEAYSVKNDGIQHYFAINLVIETDSKKNAERIESLVSQTVAEVRDIVKDYPVYGIDRVALMDYVKRDIKNKLNHVLGRDTVKGVYIGSFLGQ